MYSDNLISFEPLDMNLQDDISDFIENNKENKQSFSEINNLYFSNEQFSKSYDILDIDERIYQNQSLELLSAKEISIDQNKTNCKVNIPNFYTILEIVNILSLIKNDDLQDKLNLVFHNNEKNEYNIENTNEYYKMMGAKRKREIYKFEKEYFDDEKLNKENEKRTKKGLKPGENKNNDREEHTKYNPDNIIKKIKAIFFKYGIDFLNKILDLKGDEKLMKLDYKKYVNKLKIIADLDYLKMPLWQLFSKEISSRYTNDNKNKGEYTINYTKFIKKNKNHNENIIGNIKRNNNDSTLNFVLDMTFSNFIDLFTGKKKVENLVKEKNMEKTNINCIKIQNCFEEIKGIENILNKLKTENRYDKIYFQKFIFYLFNYEEWFCVRTPRKPKQEKNLKEINSKTMYTTLYKI